MKLEYKLTTGCRGYKTKPDSTNITSEVVFPTGKKKEVEDPRYLVSGSQNMIINDQERVETRAGSELFGAANDADNPIKSEFVWKNSSGGEILLREENGVLKWYTAGWETLLTGLSTTKIVRFDTCWNGTELIDILLFVNHSTTLYEWSGGQGTYASSTAGPNTITINETIATSRFFSSGETASIRVKDSGGTWREFAVVSHTGSVFTTTEDPTAYTFAAGALVVQSVRTNANTPDSGFTNDFIRVFQSQAFVGSETDQRLWVSQNTDYTDYTKSTPRVAGEGDTIILDAVTIGLEIPGIKETDSENKIIVFSAGDRGYKISYEISPGSTADREVARVKPLPIRGGQGALSQELIEKIGQTIVWVSNDNELLDLATIENQQTLGNVAISDPISPDFTAATFTNGDIKFWRNSIFITAPTDGKMFIYDVSKGFWQTPQILGVRRLSVYAGSLYGHSNAANETFKLFTGLGDNDNPISFKAYFAYRNAGERARLKNFNRFYTELYIAGNTTVDCSLLFEWKGSKSVQTYQLIGYNEDFLFIPTADASVGVNSLGTNPLGGLTSADESTPKYRRFKPIIPIDHFEYQVRFESEEADAAFQILCSGANIELSNNIPVGISK